MSKTRNTGFLTNVINVDTYGNVSIVSGSTTLLSVSSSGAVTTTGVVSGSNALSSSYSISGSYTVSSSYAFTASSAINSFTASNANTASSADTFIVRNNLTGSNALFTGAITAQTLVVSTISSSVEYASGSNIFGSQLTNRQTFTGSIYQTGSLAYFESNIGVSTTSPCAKIHLNSNGNYIWSVGNGYGDLYIGDGTYGLSVGTSIGGGGAGDTRMWTKGGTHTLYIGTSNIDAVKIDASQNVCIKGNLYGCSSILANNNIRISTTTSAGNATDPAITTGGCTKTGIYFDGSCVALGSGGNMLLLTQCGRVGIGTSAPDYGNLSVLGTDNTVLSSAVWGTSTGAGVLATVYNQSACTNSVAGLRLVTRNSGASVWNIYNVSTGPSAGDLAFGNGSGGTGYERLRITNDGITCFACRTCSPALTTQNIRLSDEATFGATWCKGAGGYPLMFADGGQSLGFGNSEAASPTSERLRIFHTGIACFACQICAPSLILNSSAVALSLIGGTTAYSAIRICNTGGDLWVGNAGSNGVFWNNTSAAYAGTIGTNGNTNLDIATNNTVRLTFSNAGIATFSCKPSFPGATITCTYTCTYSSYTAGCWLGLFAGDLGFNGAYAFTVVGQFNLGGSGLYSINYATMPYIHKSDSIGSTNGNDFCWLPSSNSGHADNGALVCFRRARYSGNTPVGNRTEFCMNVSYSNSFTATTYVLAWV